MALNLYSSSTHDGLFDILAKYWKALATLHTAVGTTMPSTIQAAEDQAKLISPSDATYEVAKTGLSQAFLAWQTSAVASIASQIRRNSENLTREFVRHDANVLSITLADALHYLLDEMLTQDLYVTPNVVGASLATGASNYGKTIVCYTTLRGDGRVQELTIPDAIVLTVTTVSPAVRPSIAVKGTPSQGDLLAYNWPKGSGVNLSITPTDPAASLLSNGDFEDVDDYDLPSNWIVTTGTAGSTIWVTTVQQQTITIGGSPGGGYYLVYYTDVGGKIWSTSPMAYNASGPQLELALRALPGLSLVTVATSGTSPNYTHTITMTGVAGNPTIFASANHLEDSYGYAGPTIGHAISVAGDAYSYKGRALRLDSDGLESTTLYHPLTFSPRAVYFLSFWAAQVGTSAGELRIEIVDGIGGSVINDEAGNANQLVIDQADLSSVPAPFWFSFRIPPQYSQVYLRVRIASPFTAGDRLYLDEMAIARGTQLYAGGPWIAAFAAAIPHVVDDNWTLTFTNTWAGDLQTWFGRIFFGPRAEMLLRSAGTNLIPDTVIA